MLSYTIECRDDEAELRSIALWDVGAVGVIEEDLPGFRRRLKAFFETQPDLPGPFTEEPVVDWEAQVRASWPAFTVGNRFYLAPEWDESPTPEGRLRLTIHPGMALGTGTHQATQLCLEALELAVRPGDRVLDVGTGSGILTQAALLLGASPVAGCDMETESAAIAQANVPEAAMFAGSVRAIADRSFDVVVANLNGTVLKSMFGELLRICRRTLVVSGFPESDAAGLDGGLVLTDRLTKDEWVCFLCDAVSSSPYSPPPPPPRSARPSRSR